MSTVLFVCTGNIFRSPTAAALLAARLASTEADISLDSVGTADHRGRLITPEDMKDATLVLGMA